jgi:predicted permease
VNILLRDLRQALRHLYKSPGFTAVAVLTLALGIGATSTMFSVANSLLLNPYPFPDSNRLVFVDARHASGQNGSTGYLDFLDWQEQTKVFEEMAIAPWNGKYTLTGQGEPQSVIGERTTAGFLRVLRVQPVLGRFFTADEDKPDAARVAVLTYASWQRLFAKSPDVLGRAMTLDGQTFTIIGVMPRRFALPGIPTCDFFTPLREAPASGRLQHQYGVLARLKPGVTIQQAQADMTAIARRLEQEYPATNTGWGVTVTPIRNAIAEEAGKPLLVLFSAVAFVLLLACLNLAGLSLARASGSAREIAIRISLGATRRRVMRQMLTESALLGVIGGGAGLLVASGLMNLLRTFAPKEFALDATLRIDPAMLAFTSVVSVLTGITFGMVPAWYGTKVDLNSAVKGGTANWSSVRLRGRLLSGLVIGQVAFSVVLLVGAGLLLKDLMVILHMDTGLNAEHLLTFALDLPYQRYSSSQQTTAFYTELLADLRAKPGIVAAAAVATLPMTGSYSGGPFEIEGRVKPSDWMQMKAQFNISTPDYFRAMGIPLIRGRDFDEHDTPVGLPVTIVNDTFARQFFPGEDPLGRKIKYQAKWQTIIGVVGSVKHQQPMKKPVPMIYFPYAQLPGHSMWVTVRSTGDPAALAGTMRSAVQSIDSSLPVLKLRTMQQVVDDSVAEPRLISSLLGGFAGFALALAGIGIYGLVAYSVTQRMHEMGVRIALGASSGDVLRLVLRKGVLLAGTGVVLGIPCALAVSRAIGSMLYGISSHDFMVFAGVPAVLFAVAIAASYAPAHRAATVQPTVALRYE